MSATGCCRTDVLAFITSRIGMRKHFLFISLVQIRLVGGSVFSKMSKLQSRYRGRN